MRKVHLQTTRRMLYKLQVTGFWSSEAGQHSIRVGKKLALCSRDLHMQASTLREAGELHDVGKSKLKQSVLYKNGRLTAAEKAHIDQHSYLGFKMLEGASVETRNAALRHHTVRAGEDLWLQVLHLIDIEDACSNRRCYKSAMPQEQVLKILASEFKLMDSEAVRIFKLHFEQFIEMN